MDEIFGKATSVTAWLGESDEYTGAAFDVIEQVCWAVKAKL